MEVDNKHNEIMEAIKGVDRRLGGMDSRFDSMEKRTEESFQDVNEKIFSLAEHMDERFNNIDNRFEKVDKRFDFVERKINEFHGDLTSMLRKGNKKLSKVVDKLHEKNIFNQSDRDDVLSMEPFASV
ncbi:MAG: hypothetical protein ABIH67_03600 [Candidatus Uhrbacteria bacterium]